MNVFFVPSWYPSNNDPLIGQFFKDQAIGLTKTFPNLNIGVSIWGQNDERLLLWGREPFKSMGKVIKQHSIYKFSNIGILLGQNSIYRNLTEYFTPAFTWSWKFLKGNTKNILKANAANLNSYVKQYGKVDLIHAHVAFPGGYIAAKLAFEFKLPYILTEQMSPFPFYLFLDKGNLLQDRLITAYKNAKYNIAITDGLADEMRKYEIPRIKVIPNMIDQEHFKIHSGTQKNKHFTFFSLGRIVHQKGFDILLKAFATVLEKRNAELIIGGDGEQKPDYLKFSETLGINEQVRWLGSLDRDQTLKEFQNCNAFVLASRHESMGIVIAEAMACGKPVICTRCGGPEFIFDHDAGFLVNPENEPELVEAMIKMIDNSRDFSPNVIRNSFEKKFSVPKVADQIMEVYKQALS